MFEPCILAGIVSERKTMNDWHLTKDGWVERRSRRRLAAAWFSKHPMILALTLAFAVCLVAYLASS